MMKTLIFLILLISPPLLLRGVNDLSLFLRKIDNVVTPSGVAGIDCLYVVNLSEMPRRWQRMNRLLNDLSLHGNRFEAINGWHLKDAKNLREMTCFGKRYQHVPKFHLTWGGIGCLLSHLSILKDAYERNFEVIWILEDDAVIKEHPDCLTSILSFLNEFDSEWDILYTDPNNLDPQGNYRTVAKPLIPAPSIKRKNDAYYNRKEIVNEILMRIYYRGGTYSMIISRKGMKKIYDALISLPVVIPYDDSLHFIEGIVEYACRIPIVTHPLNPDFGSSTASPQLFRTIRITTSILLCLMKQVTLNA